MMSKPVIVHYFLATDVFTFYEVKHQLYTKSVMSQMLMASVHITYTWLFLCAWVLKLIKRHSGATVGSLLSPFHTEIPQYQRMKSRLYAHSFTLNQAAPV